MIRSNLNPLIKLGDVKPSRPEFKVFGAFNAGTVEIDGTIYMLIRVAEGYETQEEGKFKIPLLDGDGENLISRTFDLNDKNFNFEDSRVVKETSSMKTIALTTISHLRLAVSKDGENFEVADSPTV